MTVTGLEDAGSPKAQFHRLETPRETAVPTRAEMPAVAATDNQAGAVASAPPTSKAVPAPAALPAAMDVIPFNVVRYRGSSAVTPSDSIFFCVTVETAFDTLTGRPAARAGRVTSNRASNAPIIARIIISPASRR
ncbi:hypothetical protein CWS72_17340 [Telmatospirillum siberiense]|uniref:Uncharacterized protein n=1 Tax=Telmatospirillum siberiense TaxID=382514 RepID=A0A2N3PS20_9PROT|nr:hypothetical protein CWS72_17340 [Telmatospirillum siberiense]